MRDKKCKIICMILAVLCVWAELDMAHFHEDILSSQALGHGENTYLLACEMTNEQAQFCTVEELGNDRNVVKKQYGSKAESVFPHLHSIRLLSSKNIENSVMISYGVLVQNELVTNYIHNSDGKKRI